MKNDLSVRLNMKIMYERTDCQTLYALINRVTQKVHAGSVNLLQFKDDFL